MGVTRLEPTGRCVRKDHCNRLNRIRHFGTLPVMAPDWLSMLIDLSRLHRSPIGRSRLPTIAGASHRRLMSRAGVSGLHDVAARRTARNGALATCSLS